MSGNTIKIIIGTAIISCLAMLVLYFVLKSSNILKGESDIRTIKNTNMSASSDYDDESENEALGGIFDMIKSTFAKAKTQGKKFFGLKGHYGGYGLGAKSVDGLGY